MTYVKLHMAPLHTISSDLLNLNAPELKSKEDEWGKLNPSRDQAYGGP